MSERVQRPGFWPRRGPDEDPIDLMNRRDGWRQDMNEYADQCEADIAELVEELRQDHEALTHGCHGRRHVPFFDKDECPICALLTKHKEAHDD